ncbi:histidine phosphatase family protein [Paracoccus sp. (in: a-proteobacteria)]|uniref:histidine phosphatase family protein n=1 Tax=Paracoccus sp. TaxID=267 RepID=UPI00272BA40B|nr:histidine phosphatase family protein [Paracoccus sp. (in: a-proteobacteria)]
MSLMILRHAAALTGGLVTGRREVEADCSDRAALARMAAQIGRPAQVWSSPARRCLQTAHALGLSPDRILPALLEQDQGEWEGRPLADLPDLGPLSPEALARHRPQGGESFHDMAARARPALVEAPPGTLIVAHAGTVRAALAMVVGARALSFAVAPLSLTILHRIDPEGAEWAVEAVNLTLPGDA